jgi:hypothetical protein
MCTVGVIQQSCKQTNHLILWWVGNAPDQDFFIHFYVFLVNLLEGRVAPHVHRHPRAVVSSCSGITSLRSKSVVHSSDELTIIDHRSLGSIRIRWRVPLLTGQTWVILVHSMQPHVNHEGTVTVPKTEALILLVLAHCPCLCRFSKLSSIRFWPFQTKKTLLWLEPGTR